VLGRGQAALPGSAERGAGVEREVVRRFSGGGAVLLTPDMLSLDVAIPAGHPLLRGEVSAAFLPVGRAWASALGALGVGGLEVNEGPSPARRAGTPRERLLAAVCYATLGRGEVSAGGRKLVGLSQRRRRHGALVQCGLLRRWRPGPLLAALGAEPDDPEVARAAVGLDELAGAAPSDDDVMREVSRWLIEEGSGDG
jgi:lipoate-protein ligase A